MTFLPQAGYITSNLAKHSIDASQVADPVYHNFLVNIFETSITGNNVKDPPKMGELLTRLQVRLEEAHISGSLTVSHTLSLPGVFHEEVIDRSGPRRRRPSGVLQHQPLRREVRYVGRSI